LEGPIRIRHFGKPGHAHPRRRTSWGTLTFSSATAGVLNGGTLQFSNSGSFSISLTGGTESARALLNISTLAFVNQGMPVTVGFVLGGSQSREVLIRAVGPSLAQFGLTNFAPNPTYLLSPSSNSLEGPVPINTTTDYPGESPAAPGDPHKPVGWSATAASASTLAAESFRAGAFALLQGSNDKADIFLLGPGAYTIT